MPTLYRTYRPQTFAEVSAQEHVKKTLQNQLKTNKVAHAYLFTGPRGVGKTTVARLLAKAVNCEKWSAKSDSKSKPFEPCNKCQMCQETTNGSALDVFEIDAASHTGVDNVRELIDGVRFSPNKGRYKVYIIDEVHMLSTAAFNALLKTLEEPPVHAIFILATTEIHKVPATVVSRCQRFDFRRFTPAEIVARLKNLAQAEKVKINDEVLFEVARHSDGCERDAESLLGQLLALGEKEINLEAASLVLPVAYTDSVLSFVEALARSEAAPAIKILNEGVEQGMDIPAFLDGVILLSRTILLAKLGGLERFQEAYEEAALKRVGGLSEIWSLDALVEALDYFLSAKRSSKTDVIPQLSTELAAIKICHPPKKIVSSHDDEEKKTKDNDKEDKSSTKTETTKPVADKKDDVIKNVLSIPEVITNESIISGRAVGIDEVRAKWNELNECLQDTNPSLLLILRNGEIVRTRGNQVEVEFEFALHVETINRAKNKKSIDEALSRLLETSVSVVALHQPRAAQADEAVAMLTKAFGGQAV